MRSLTPLVLLALPLVLPAQPTVRVDTPMTPPDWALLERALLDANSRSVEEFADRYIDERGYLLHTMRWGTLDGPDDAIETYYNWTLLHALGGSDSTLELYKKGLEGHLLQYNELRTELTEIAAHGAYHKEFITQSDWFHTGEGMRGFLLMGFADPTDQLLVNRMKRFAGMYMDEDPEAKNYDPEHKIIKSIWTGSRGPMIRQATVYDWVGDPVPGTFHLLHNPARDNEMLDLMKWYPRMLAHCEGYLDSAGDNFLNLGATLLGLNAYALTGEQKYKDWTVGYLDAWKRRAAETGGWIPSNVGLDGKLGGEHNGQWWKGTYGWKLHHLRRRARTDRPPQLLHRRFLDRLRQRPAAHRRPVLRGRAAQADGPDLRRQEGGGWQDAAADHVRRPEGLRAQRQAGVVRVPPGDLQRPPGGDLPVVDAA
ncbi:MAG: hypothetical protein GC160_08390 [Acidobacteria bacterium]|nr:hypothetical protein [Acidobacteriota bacterium]